MSPKTRNNNKLRVLVAGTSNRLWKIGDPLGNVGDEVVTHQITGKESIQPLMKKISNHDPDIIITDSLGRAGVAVYLLSVIYRSECVLRIRGDAMTERTEKMYENMKARSFKGATQYFLSIILTVFLLCLCRKQIYVSSYCRDKSRMRFFSTSTAIVIPTPLDDLEQGTTSESCCGRKNILAVTNFNFRQKTKALEQAVPVIADLLEQHPDWTFRIAGSGPHMESVRAVIQENDVDSISMLGYVENVDELYRSAEIFVHFSYLDAYPSTVIEASAHRLPVVTNHGFGMSDQIIDEQNGFIVDLNDSKELRSKLRLLMNNKCERLKMSENARSVVEKNNSLQAIGEQFHRYLIRSP